MDYNRINEAAKSYLPAMTKFLRDLIRIPERAAQRAGLFIA